MKTVPTSLVLALGLALVACNGEEVLEKQFGNAGELRQSSLFKKGMLPEDFIAIFPPSVRDIHFRKNTADTISHMKFRLTKLPGDYFTLISRMELALKSEVESVQPFEPEGADWWDAEEVRANFSEDAYVFRKLPLGVGDAVFIATSEVGVVYAWIDR